MSLLNIKLLISKWERSNFETYQEAYHLFGGSVCTHPDVLQFLSKTLGVAIEFYSKTFQGKLQGACYSTNGQLSLQDKRYPIVFDDILFPFADNGQFTLPFRSKRLSPGHKGKFLNVVHSDKLKHKIAYIKDNFSKSTEKKRNGELKKFLMSGGEIRDIHSFSTDEIASIYIKLFKARWQDKIYCFKHQDLHHALQCLRHLLFGCVLIKEGEVCAMDIIFKSECKDFIYFDDINGGFSQSFPEYNLGTIMLWANILKARELCLAREKTCKFSLGIYRSYWSYKKQWCDIIPLGRTII